MKVTCEEVGFSVSATDLGLLRFCQDNSENADWQLHEFSYFTLEAMWLKCHLYIGPCLVLWKNNIKHGSILS